MLVSWCDHRRKGKNAKEDNSCPSQFAAALNPVQHSPHKNIVTIIRNAQICIEIYISFVNRNLKEEDIDRNFKN